MHTSQLARRIAEGDRAALSKGISLVENQPELASKLLALTRRPPRAFVLGVTGPPGTGKSTLIDRLVDVYRRKKLRVGVIAVDPSSPLTGGALLGDRIRMSGHAGDDGVFIRSMASRGWSGGLSRAASQAVQLMDAAGFDVVFLETVGIGQSDIEVVGLSHAVLVVLMPGMGDEVQASKAGLMEVGDVYVVNKGDAEGSDSMVVSILGMVRDTKGRSPSVIKVSALNGDGLDRLEVAVEAIRSRFKRGDPSLRLRSAKEMIVQTARWDLMQRLDEEADARAEGLARLVVEGKLGVDEAAARLARLR